MHLEVLILRGLVEYTQFFSTVTPHLKSDYFHDVSMSSIVEFFKRYVDKYNRPPSYAALKVLCEKSAENNKLRPEVLDGCIDILERVQNENESIDIEWLTTETETYFRNQAVINALADSIQIHDQITKETGKSNHDLGAIPDILTEALQVSFDTSTGHDWLGDAEERFKSYSEKVDKIPFHIDILNTATNGGAERKTLNVILAGTNVGKSLGLVDLARHYTMNLGLNGVYCSFEMSETIVGKRTDAGAFKLSMDDFELMTPKVYSRKISAIRNQTNGNLFFKQFATAGAHVGHIRAWLKDLELKKGIKPDFIMIDYLGIMLSSRMRSSENTYLWIKSIAEEVRGLMIDYNAIGWSAAQVNRAGNDTLEIDLNHVAESAALSHTVDFMMAMAESEELAAEKKQVGRQLKSRYGDKNKYKTMLFGVDKDQQRWYNVKSEINDPKQEEVHQRAVDESFGEGSLDMIEDKDETELAGVNW